MEFTKVENLKDYILSNKLDAAAGKYQKKGEIRARKGVVGEEIVTVMSNGLVETKNTVVADADGNPGWVVSNPTGERYIVKDEIFRKKYEKIEGTQDGYRPIWNPITATQVSENICFVAPWGELMNLVSGGYLVFNENFDDVYGIQEPEFNETYGLVD